MSLFGRVLYRINNIFFKYYKSYENIIAFHQQIFIS